MITSSSARKVLGVYEYLSGTSITKAMAELKFNQNRSQDELYSQSVLKLHNLLSHAVVNSEYYSHLIPFDPELQLQNFDILQQIEYLDKTILRNNVDRITSKNPVAKMTLAKTSGSTGIPLRFPKDAHTRAYHYAAMYRGHSWYELGVGEREARLWGVPVSKKDSVKTYMKDYLLNRFRENDFNLSDSALEDFCRSVLRRKPDYIMGYGKMLFGFARYLKQNNRNLSDLNLKMAKYTSEILEEADKAVVREVFGCPVVSEYGAAETGIISFQCPQGGNHIMSDCLHVELLDCPDILNENIKEIVVTDLNSLSFPIIRYRLGDLVELSKEACSCNLPFPLIGRIIGRSSEIFSVGDGRKFHSLIFYYIVKGLGDVSKLMQFRVVQKSTNTFIYQLCGIDKGADIENYLIAKTKQELGVDVKLTFEYLKHMPREESGKLRDFVPMPSNESEVF